MEFSEKVDAMKRAVKADGISAKFNALKEAVKAGNAPPMNKDVRLIVERIIAQEAGRVWCQNCGKELTDPKSIALGIGPECRKPLLKKKVKA
ncbi:MAG: DUF6011 domain-containing protein [Terracidiphilus sp.]|jgi:hypothetical protein